MSRRLSNEEYICQDCGYMGRAALKLRGSAIVERLLWCLLIIPGPFYSYWRRQGGEVECAGCADGYIVKVDSKLGMVMLENKLRGSEKRKPIIRKN